MLMRCALIRSCRAALFGVMQFALFGLLTAIFALKRPYLTLDLWVQRSPHKIGLSPQCGQVIGSMWLALQRRIFSAL